MCVHADITEEKSVILMDSYSTVIKILEKLHHDEVIETSARHQLPTSSRPIDNCNVKTAITIGTIICSNC